MATFYISSTVQDLQDYRREVSKILRRRGHTVISMEDYGPSGRLPLDKCLEDVVKCDIYVGIVARRYGFILSDDNPDKKSITECEYRHAKKTEKECWIFLLAEEASWPLNFVDTDEPGERVKCFRDELRTKNVVRFFKDLKGLKREVEKAVNKRFSRLRSWWAWLTELFPPWPLYVTIPLALIVALLAAALAIGIYYWSLSPTAKTDFLIKYKIWPGRFTDPMEDYFDLPPGTNPDESQCIAPKNNLWNYPVYQWCVIRSKFAKNPGSGTLSVRGPDWGVRNDLEGKALYDFEMRFVVIFEKGDEAAWVVRAQKDKRSGYVFKLQRERREGDAIRLFLHGEVYTGDGKPVPLGDTPKQLQLGDIYDSDYFVITITAIENTFSHQVRIQNFTNKEPTREGFREPLKVSDFKDGKNYFSYGNVGFFVPVAGGEILIDNFRLTQPPSPTPTPSDGG